MLGLFLDGNSVVARIKFHYAEALRVVYVVAEHSSAAIGLGILNRLTQVAAKAVAVEDVIAQNQCARFASNKFLADDECLRQAIGRRLFRVGKRHAKLGAIAQQTLEIGQIGRRGNDQNVLDARHHQHGERVVDHGLVVHRQQLLAGHRGERVQARSATTCKYYAFHGTSKTYEE